jgi:hypothetical protein
MAVRQFARRDAQRFGVLEAAFIVLGAPALDALDDLSAPSRAMDRSISVEKSSVMADALKASSALQNIPQHGEIAGTRDEAFVLFQDKDLDVTQRREVGIAQI